MPIDPAVLARLRELYDKWQASKGEREIYNALVIFVLAYLPALIDAAEAGMRDTVADTIEAARAKEPADVL